MEMRQLTPIALLSSYKIVRTAVNNVLNIMSVCLHFCLCYPEGKSHTFCNVLHCYPWPVRLYHICPHYLTNGTISGKQKQNTRCVL